MPQVTIHAVAVESADSGKVDWFYDEKAANDAFSTAVAEYGSDRTQEMNLYSFQVPNDASPDEITHQADALMWERSYTPIRSHNREASLSAH